MGGAAVSVTTGCLLIVFSGKMRPLLGTHSFPAAGCKTRRVYGPPIHHMGKEAGRGGVLGKYHDQLAPRSDK